MPLDLNRVRRAPRISSAISTALAASLALGIAGCSSLASDLAGGTDGERSADPPSGVWSYVDGGFVSNTCGTTDLYRDPDTQFTLVNAGDGTFEVRQGEPYGDFGCTIDGTTFMCPQRLTTDTPVEGTSATVFAHVSITGTFSDDEAIEGEQRVEISCEGQECALAPAVLGAAFPCEYVVAFTAGFGG